MTTPRVTKLANGLRVVTHAMPHLETLSLCILVGAGARHEVEEENGISHVLEHMAFKGTARRSARQIAEEIESVGGELNAATSLETTTYYARVLKGDDGTALEILADILQNSLYAEAELEREREVILQEIAGIRDSPDELAYDLVHDAAFPDQPVGRPIIGTPASVKSFSGDDLRRFLAAHYVGSDMVVSAAGAVDHDMLVRRVEDLLGKLPAAASNAPPPARYVGGQRSSRKPFEQSHLLLGFAGPSYREPDYFTAQVFSGLMGGGMSSRLFQEVREARGLCYAIYSSAWGLSDAGMFTVHAATGTEQLIELVEVVTTELVKAASSKPGDAEIARAKSQLKAGLMMSLESSSARAEQMARHLLVYDRVLSPAQLIERVDAVTADSLQALAGRILAGAPPSAVVVGAGQKSGDYARRALRLLAA
jgi:predicted Zn-dependent peptidase